MLPACHPHYQRHWTLVVSTLLFWFSRSVQHVFHHILGVVLWYVHRTIIFSLEIKGKGEKMQKVEIMARLPSWSLYACLDYNPFSFFNKYLVSLPSSGAVIKHTVKTSSRSMSFAFATLKFWHCEFIYFLMLTFISIFMLSLICAVF